MTLCNGMSRVAHHHCGLSSVWVAVSMIVMGACVLDLALAVISGELVAGAATIVDCDVAVAIGSSGCEMKGLGPSWGVVGLAGSSAVISEMQGAIWRVGMVLWWLLSMALAAMTWL
jgi:hypothetical protein